MILCSRIKANPLVQYNGTVGRLREYKKNWRSVGVKKGKGTGKIMLSPGVAWKCQTWENRLFPSGVYSTRWEVSQRRLFSSGVSESSGGATWSRVLEGFAPMAPQKIPPLPSQGHRGICCRPRWALSEASDAREKRYSADEACPHKATLSCLLPYVWPDAVCAPSGRCFIIGKPKTPAGRTPGLASPEPETWVEISLVFRLQNHDDAGTGYTGCRLGRATGGWSFH